MGVGHRVLPVVLASPVHLTALGGTSARAGPLNLRGPRARPRLLSKAGQLCSGTSVCVRLQNLCGPRVCPRLLSIHSPAWLTQRPSTLRVCLLCSSIPCSCTCGGTSAHVRSQNLCGPRVCPRLHPTTDQLGGRTSTTSCPSLTSSLLQNPSRPAA